MEATKSLETLLADWERNIRLKDHVCFYGGTFNPWHDGHGTCIQLAKTFYKNQKQETDIVIVIDNNPWKEQNLTDAGKLELYKSIKNQSHHSLIYPGFLLKNDANPTYDWVKDFKEKNKKSVDLLVGFDNFEKFDQWKNYGDLLKLLTRLLVVSRQDQESSKADMLEKIKGISPQTEVHFLGNHDYEHLSSSLLRKEQS